MSDTIRILIVEDKEDNRVSYQDTIDLFNKKHFYSINPTMVENLQEGLRELDSNHFDGAIIDLKLSGDNDDHVEGNEIIKGILNIRRIPILVYSAFLGDLDADIDKHGRFFQKFKKEEDLNVLLQELHAIYSTGITKILGKNGRLRELIDRAFWDHLSESLEYWFKEKNESTLLRYILTHVQEMLDLDENQGFVKYNPAEFYIRPSIKPSVFTGSILQHSESGKNHIVLSPACDLAQAKAKSIVLAEIEPLTIELVTGNKNILKKKQKENPTPEEYEKEYDKRSEAKNVLVRLFSNNYANKYHYMPKTNWFDGGLVNFQNISSQPFKTIDEEYEVIAVVTANFIKDVIARYSYYYSRQGSPDFDTDTLVDEFLAEE